MAQGTCAIWLFKPLEQAVGQAGFLVKPSFLSISPFAGISFGKAKKY